MDVERLPALELSEKAKGRKYSGQLIVPSRGVPMLPMPPHVVEAVAHATRNVHPRNSRGSSELKETIAQHLQDDFKLFIDPDRELLVTHGAQHGMSVTLRGLLSPGDEVLVPSPSYFFDGTIRLAGAIPQYVASREADDWRLPIDDLEVAISSRTRAVVLCNPNNPTGVVLTHDELAGVLDLAERHGLYVISDESYERYIYDEYSYIPQMTFANRYSNMITITSLSKNYALTSWRIGYIHAHEDLIDRIHNALEWDTINVGDVAQAAATAAISGPQDWLDNEFKKFPSRRDLVLEVIEQAGFTTVAPQAGIFAFVNFQRIEDPTSRIEDTLLDVGITALSGERFFGPRHCARVLYGGTERSLVQLGQRLKLLSNRNI